MPDPYAEPRTCIKCGWHGPVAIYWRANLDCSSHPARDEHLDLSCRRCGWSETDPPLNLDPS